jgi:hypothetical protein
MRPFQDHALFVTLQIQRSAEYIQTDFALLQIFIPFDNYQIAAIKKLETQDYNAK